jgi:hypothetical protein
MAGPAQRYEGAVHGAWSRYGRIVRACVRGRPSADFERSGFVVGTLPADVVEQFRDAVARSQTTRLEADDWSPGYRHSEKVHKVGATLNAGHRYYAPGPELHAALGAVARELDRPVREAIGSPWRIVHTRVLETLPEAVAMGPNAWHGDGFPVDILKVMAYFTAAGPESGTTELQLADGSSYVVEGPPGTWLLFKNSEIVHRGIPPTQAPRLAVELTLVPALRSNLDPCFAGLNSTYPEHPGWSNPAARWVWRTAVATPLKALDARRRARTTS